MLLLSVTDDLQLRLSIVEMVIHGKNLGKDNKTGKGLENQVDSKNKRRYTVGTSETDGTASADVA